MYSVKVVLSRNLFLMGMVILCLSFMANCSDDSILEFEDGRIWDFKVSQDNSYVVYPYHLRINDTYESLLYTVPIGGESAAQLIKRSAWLGFDISPDSKRIVYITGQNIYSAPIEGEGGDAVKLSVVPQ